MVPIEKLRFLYVGNANELVSVVEYAAKLLQAGIEERLWASLTRFKWSN
jgi:hypothetical protein